MKDTPVDMRKYMPFPEAPSSTHEIFCYPGDAWKIACAMAGKFDAQQFNAFRALDFAMQDDDRYRNALAVTRDILAHATNIRNRAAFVYAQLAAELSSVR